MSARSHANTCTQARTHACERDLDFTAIYPRRNCHANIQTRFSKNIIYFVCLTLYSYPGA